MNGADGGGDIGPEDYDDELAVLMQESPVGSTSQDYRYNEVIDRKGVPGLSLIPHREMIFHGMTAHRSVLSERDASLLDRALLRAMVEEELGISVVEISVLYRSGRPDAQRQAGKDGVDDKFLDIQESGGNMSILAEVLGWHIRENGECRMMTKALRRARTRRYSGEE